MKNSITNQLKICNEMRIANGLRPIKYTAYWYRHIDGYSIEEISKMKIKKGGVPCNISKIEIKDKKYGTIKSLWREYLEKGGKASYNTFRIKIQGLKY